MAMRKRQACALSASAHRLSGKLALAVAILALALAPGAARAQATTHDRLEALANDFVYTTARLRPMQATALGIAGHDGELELPSEADRAAYIGRVAGWQTQLAAITAAFDSSTSMIDRDDARLLDAQLKQQLNALRVYQFDRKDYSAPGN